MKPFSTEIWFGDRVAVLGSNGSGKSHFLRLLARGGSDPDVEHQPVDDLQIAPVAHTGKAKLGARVRPGWFAQTHHHPELLGRTLLEILHRGDDHRAGMGREEASRKLDRYELAKAAEQRFESLSGGQQARFQILLLELSGATLLLLDEPTDNLDLESAEALEHGPRRVRGHRGRGDPRPLVRPRFRPVPGLRRRRRGVRVRRAGLGRGAGSTGRDDHARRRADSTWRRLAADDRPDAGRPPTSPRRCRPARAGRWPTWSATSGETHLWARARIRAGNPDAPDLVAPVTDPAGAPAWYRRAPTLLVSTLRSTRTRSTGAGPSVRRRVRRPSGPGARPTRRRCTAGISVRRSGGTWATPSALALDGIDEVVTMFFPRQVRLRRIPPLTGHWPSRSTDGPSGCCTRTARERAAGPTPTPRSAARPTRWSLLLWGRLGWTIRGSPLTGDRRPPRPCSPRASCRRSRRPGLPPCRDEDPRGGRSVRRPNADPIGGVHPM